MKNKILKNSIILILFVKLLNCTSSEKDLSTSTCESNKNKKEEEKKILKNYTFETNSASITYIQGLMIIGILEQFRPNNICEYGAGVSSGIFQTYCEKYNKSLLTIEHDVKYQTKESKLFSLIENTTVTINNVKYGKTNKYEGLEEFFSKYDKKFDFVFIDGPFGCEREYYAYTRIQMLDLIEYDLLSDEGYFLIHDTERKNGQASIKVLLSLFEQKNYTLLIEELGLNQIKMMTIIKFKKKMN